MATASANSLQVRPGDEEAVDKVEQWFRDYQATRDPAIRERIILAYLGLADRLAARFPCRGSHDVAREDLVQAARVGLVGAVDRYDPGRPNPFIVYAIACINGELRRCLRDTSWRVHVARTLKELALQVVKARDTLTATLQGTVASGSKVRLAGSRVEPLPVQTAARSAQCNQSWHRRLRLGTLVEDAGLSGRHMQQCPG
jgi:RNA polymerase sigma factor (sigma-70 family)